MGHMKIFVEPGYEEDPSATTRTMHVSMDPEHKLKVYEHIRTLCRNYYNREIPTDPYVPNRSDGVIGIFVEIKDHPKKEREFYERFNVDIMDCYERDGWNLIRGHTAFDQYGMLFKRENDKKDPSAPEEQVSTSRKRKN